jgi:processive 1,2-diacylglycerol beta-glucosyltransferase
MARVLLTYISEISGHHCASLAVEKAIKIIAPEAQTINVNAFNYINPILEKVINRAYMSVIRRRPEVWEYLYDNPQVVRRSQKLKEMIHRFNSVKLKALLESFRPDVITCTQAFPCGLIADYKISHNLKLPLLAILTDYAPHSYWIYDSVDYYIVPSEMTKNKLIKNGVQEEKIKILGIPIDPKFIQPVNNDELAKKVGLDKDSPCVLIMGGGHGLGPIKEVIFALDRVRANLQMIVICGHNKKLYTWLMKKQSAFSKKIFVYGYADNVQELMHLAQLIVTKPGGVTTAEALACGLPLLIVNPIPGQEAKNTDFLLSAEVAVKAQSAADVSVLTEELLKNPAKLQRMRQLTQNYSKANAALEIAKLVLALAKSKAGSLL